LFPSALTLCSTSKTSRSVSASFASEFDPQPFHLSEELAKKTQFGGVAASGWRTAALTMSLLVDGGLAAGR